MKTFGKLCLLLVVFGWFCPVACNLSGPQWLASVDDGNPTTALCSIGLLASAAIALLGVILAIVNLIKKSKDKTSKSNDNIATSVISGLCGFPFFVFMVISYQTLEILNYGAFIMIGGWLLSLVFRILGNKESKAPKLQPTQGE